jgi:hypothetical protein
VINSETNMAAIIPGLLMDESETPFSQEDVIRARTMVSWSEFAKFQFVMFCFCSTKDHGEFESAFNRLVALNED